MKKALISGSAIFLLPLIALAQGNLINLLVLALQVVNLVIPLLIAIALIVFFWGLIKYISGAGGEKSDSGKRIMIAGIVALFIMVSIWGIIRLIGNTVGIQQGAVVVPPRIEFGAY